MPHKQGKIFDQAVDHDQKQGDPYIDITKAQGNPYPASAHAFNGLADHKPAAKQRRIRHKRVQHKGAQPFAGKQRPDGSCPAAPGAVRSGQGSKNFQTGIPVTLTNKNSAAKITAAHQPII